MRKEKGSGRLAERVQGRVSMSGTIRFNHIGSSRVLIKRE